jgi:hypothetical protein
MVNTRRAQQHFANEAIRASSAPNCDFSASQHGRIWRVDWIQIGAGVLLRPRVLAAYTAIKPDAKQLQLPIHFGWSHRGRPTPLSLTSNLNQ